MDFVSTIRAAKTYCCRIIYGVPTILEGYGIDKMNILKQLECSIYASKSQIHVNGIII